MHKKTILLLVAFLALFAIGLSRPAAVAAAQSTQAGGEVFKTPEDAITTFFDGLAQGDIQKIYAACAIDEMAENYKFDLMIDRLRAFIPVQSLAPANYPLYVELNRDAVAARISTQIKLFAFSLLSGEQIDMTITTVMDGDAARKLMQEMDPARLAGLKLLKIGLPSQEIMNSARYRENAAKMAATNGADDSTERVALFSFEQRTYILGFTLLHYGDNWKIATASSPIAGTNALGIPQAMSQADFEALTQ